MSDSGRGRSVVLNQRWIGFAWQSIRLLCASSFLVHDGSRRALQSKRMNTNCDAESKHATFAVALLTQARASPLFAMMLESFDSAEANATRTYVYNAPRFD